MARAGGFQAFKEATSWPCRSSPFVAGSPPPSLASGRCQGLTPGNAHSRTPARHLRHAWWEGSRLCLFGSEKLRLEPCRVSSEGTQEAKKEEEKVAVSIRTQHSVNFGETIKIVGTGPALGDWDPTVAPGMAWAEGDEWSVSIDVAPGQYDFKCVVIREDGSIAEWEPGENRILEVPSLESKEPQTLEVICPWSNTSATFMSFDEDDATARLEASRENKAVKLEQTSDGKNPAADLDTGGITQLDPSQGKDDGDDGVTVEDKVEAVAAALEYPEHGDKDITESPVEASSNGTAGSAEGLARLDRLAPKDDERPVEEKVEEVAKAIQQQEEGLNGGSLDSSSSSPEKIDDNLEVQSTPASRSGQEAESGTGQVQSGSDVNSPSLTAFQSQDGAVTAAQQAAILLGVVGIPIVAWSEYTLKTTGCGLPPGPNGLLGAAEGISYLAVLAIAIAGLASKASTGKGLPAGPGGILGAIEGLSYATIVAGAAVLGFQYKEYGYIPAALPDKNCFGADSKEKRVSLNRTSSRFFTPVSSQAPRLVSVALTQNSLPLHATLKNEVAEVSESKSERNNAQLEALKAAAKVKEAVAPARKSAADLPFLKRDVKKLGSVFDSSEAPASSPQVAAEQNSRIGSTVGKAIEGVQSLFMNGPQSSLEALSSGAEDGLSGAELEPVVEELQNALASLGSFFSSLKDKLTGTSSTSKPVNFSLTSSQAFVVADGNQEWDSVPRTLFPSSQTPFRFVAMDMGLATATTTASSAANNVTQNLNSQILQLQSSIDGVKDVVEDVASATEEDTTADTTTLSSAIVDLKGTLERVEELTPEKAVLQPLVNQLEDTAQALQQEDERKAAKFEAAASSVREAESTDVTPLAQATQEAAQAADNGETSKKRRIAIEPAIATVTRIKSLLSDAQQTLQGVVDNNSQQ